MFRKIRYRLFLSNLAVLAMVVIGSALVVRGVFISNLKRQTSEQLMTISQATAASAELEDGDEDDEDDEDDREGLDWEMEFPPQLLKETQLTFQWFDPQGKLLEQQGKNRYISTLPLKAEPTIQDRNDVHGLEIVTMPIFEEENGQLIGYLRASQSLEKLDAIIIKLDMGLAVGAIVAVVLSSLGSGWLNRQAMQPIEESFKRLKEFTAHASHELRSPLMAISTNAEVALTYPDGMRKSDGEKFQAIIVATEQMTRLTEDLLLLARTDRVADFEFKRIDLTTLLKDLFKLYQPQAQSKQIKLKAEINHDLWLNGDEAKLTRAFTNLIQNAIQYTPAGGEVKLTGDRLKREIKVTVTDTGIGIAPEDLDLVFDRLWRADRSRSHYKGGSGLGLAITRAIVCHHKGKINVTSQLNVGSSFVVTLPAVVD